MNRKRTKLEPPLLTTGAIASSGHSNRSSGPWSCVGSIAQWILVEITLVDPDSGGCERGFLRLLP
jgi:hypothetical protein